MPAVKGGAMEGLVEQLLKENEIFQKADFFVASIFDEEAEKAAKSYRETKFFFLKPPVFFSKLDQIIHWFAFDLFHSSRHLAFKTLFQRSYYIYQVADLLHKEHFDRVVFENQMALLWALKYKDNLKKYEGKYDFHLHNHPARYAKAEKLAAGCRRIIGVSQFIGKAFAEKIGVPYQKPQFTVLRNTSDETVFTKEKVSENIVRKLRDKYQIEEKNVILYVGRLIPGKGVKELLEAFRDGGFVNTKLIIVGSFNFNTEERSTYEEALQKITEVIPQDQIAFTGFVPHNELPDYFALADIVVLPSTCEDAANLVAIETIMMNRPLITTTMGGIPEYADQSCAVLVENDIHLKESLIEAMKDLLSNKEKRIQMSENARSVSAGWTLKNYYNTFLEIMDEE